MAEPTPTPTPTPDPTPWVTGKLENEYLGHAQTKGWDKLSPIDAAVAATKAHREAEQRLGVPADKLVRLADPKNEVETRAMWQKLGAPAEAKDYDFSSLKTAAGTDPDPKFVDAVRAAAAKTFMPKDMATQFADAVIKFNDAAATEAQAVKAATQTTEKAALEKNWGPNFEPNKFVAMKGAEKLGFTAAQVAALENVAGYAATMEAMRRVGELAGEAKFIQGGPHGNVVMTREQAKDAKDRLFKDEGFVKRYNAGDAAAYREMQALDIILTAPDK